MLWDLCIVGGGMSGLVAAIEAKRNFPEFKIAIFEKEDRIGKKILATGNGRCNLENMTACEKDYNLPYFVSSVLNEFTPQSNLEFWESMGLLTCCDSEGRVYPKSNMASSVLDILRLETEKLKIKIINEKAENICKDKYFKINREESKRVIIAAGGCSSPKQGSDGSGFLLAEKLGHKITPLSPSLVQITTENSVTKQLKGIRVKGNLILLENGKILGASDGEILFADYGLSGIATMDLSRFLMKAKDKTKVKISLDMFPDKAEKEIMSYLFDRKIKNPEAEAENLLIGILPKQVGKVILKKSKIMLSEKIKNLTEKDFENITKLIKNFVFAVTGTKGYDFSQVTAGGVCTDEINEKTLMSKKVKNLYFCGEIIDVDARCGGFNLHWAVSSARQCACLKE